MSHVTQEQAKRLKELGYPQGDLNEIGRAVQCNCGLQMMHVDLDTDWTVGIDYTHLAHDWDIDHKWYRAPSAEELMEWLPSENPHAKDDDFTGWDFTVQNCKHHDPKVHVNGGKWVVGYEGIDGYMDPEFAAERLIDALYSCACWVLEGKK